MVLKLLCLMLFRSQFLKNIKYQIYLDLEVYHSRSKIQLFCSPKFYLNLYQNFRHFMLTTSNLWGFKPFQSSSTVFPAKRTKNVNLTNYPFSSPNAAAKFFSLCFPLFIDELVAKKSGWKKFGRRKTRLTLIYGVFLFIYRDILWFVYLCFLLQRSYVTFLKVFRLISDALL